MGRVLAVSDLHGQLPEVPAGTDLLLIAGDICPDFHPFARVEQQAGWLDTTFRNWLRTLHMRGCSVVATWGNHDYIGEHPELIPTLPWDLLVDDVARVETSLGGVTVWGTPWVPNLPRWAFYGSERALETRAELIPAGIDVLMTHGPPLRAGDYVPGSERQMSKYGNERGMHVGDRSLNRAINRTKPLAVICGHIHEARGTHYVGDVPVYNVSAVDAQYTLYPEPFRQLYLEDD